ncbi:uncharacterized protein LOC106464830 isoform X2 [Limulus polyphemus]|uniref:Uncharacterized protein LOC106464830 isoform X2 n=1 Tax=Limulus polyphemus TaxID=6850 RepID=A0ABM1SXI3_LIMPO|nr:uncharacterized protein LOC106464830 isoform X2 [Limulus polyphemus]
MSIKKIFTDLGKGVRFPAHSDRTESIKPTAIFYFEGCDPHLCEHPPEATDLYHYNQERFPNTSIHCLQSSRECLESSSDTPQSVLDSEPYPTIYNTTSFDICLSEEDRSYVLDYSQEELTKVILSREDRRGYLGNEDIGLHNKNSLLDLNSKILISSLNCSSKNDLASVGLITVMADTNSTSSSATTTLFPELPVGDEQSNTRYKHCYTTDFSKSCKDRHHCTKASCSPNGGSGCNKSSLLTDEWLHSEYGSIETDDVTKRENTADYATSLGLERRNKSNMFEKIRNLTNRVSSSTGEDDRSQSSDCKETEELDKVAESEFSHDHNGRSTASSLFGRVRHLHKDVKKRISRLKSSRSIVDTEQLQDDQQDESENPSETIPSMSSSSLQVESPSSGNLNFTSAGEDEETPYSGPILSQARALVDYTPSPYDRDALAFKKGDIIEIIAKYNTGIWVGTIQGRIGSFKFINVQEIEGEKKSRQRHSKRSPQLASLAAIKPQSLEDVLNMIGLQQYTHVLVLNGYDQLECFKDIELEDLEGLGILEPEHQQELLRAADVLLEYIETVPASHHDMATHPERKVVIEERVEVEKSEHDSGYYTSNGHLVNEENAKDNSVVYCVEYHSTSNNDSSVKGDLDVNYWSNQNNLSKSSVSSNNTRTEPLCNFDVPISCSHDAGLVNTKPYRDDKRLALKNDKTVVLRSDDSCRSKTPGIKNVESRTEAKEDGSSESIVRSSSKLADCEYNPERYILVGQENYTQLSNYCPCSTSSESRAKKTLCTSTRTVEKTKSLTSHDVSSEVYCGSGSTKEERSTIFHRKKPQNPEDPPDAPKRGIKKHGRNHGFQNCNPHISQDLNELPLVKSKLGKESDHHQSRNCCDKPQNLAPRNIKGLEKDIDDVAEALDKSQISTLQQQEKQRLPNTSELTSVENLRCYRE